jgi:hypothetical protein
VRRLTVAAAALAVAASAQADLDSKQKRGSVVGLSLPGRPWLAEPDGTLSSTDRVALMTYASAVAPAAPGGVVVPVLLHQY